MTARVELWVEARHGEPAVNPVIAAVLDALDRDGTPVGVRVPEHTPPDDDARGPDLVLLKTVTAIGLACATAAASTGTRVLNDAAATVQAGDKAETVARLAAAGLPVPTTHLLDPSGGVTGLARDDGPWVSKPVRGWHGRGVRHHASLAAACAAGATAEAVHDALVDDGTRLLQRRIGPPDEPDLKIYVADDRTFAGTKTFRTTSYLSDDVERAVLTPAAEELVRAAGAALGLRVFGVDLRRDRPGDELVVVDVNPFPGFRGFPDAVPALLAEIDRSLKET